MTLVTKKIAMPLSEISSSAAGINCSACSACGGSSRSPDLVPGYPRWPTTMNQAQARTYPSRPGCHTLCPARSALLTWLARPALLAWTVQWPFALRRGRLRPGTACWSLRVPRDPEPPALTAPPSLPAVRAGTLGADLVDGCGLAVSGSHDPLGALYGIVRLSWPILHYLPFAPEPRAQRADSEVLAKIA